MPQVVPRPADLAARLESWTPRHGVIFEDRLPSFIRRSMAFADDWRLNSRGRMVDLLPGDTSSGTLNHGEGDQLAAGKGCPKE